MPPVPVLAAQAERTDLPVYLNAIGTVEAFSSVAVKSQVAGQLLKVHFQEGQDVKQGDMLFTIDDRPYKAALHQAEANLAKNQIQAKNAEANRQRYSSMMKQNAAAESEYDTARTTAEALAAQVMADEAAVEEAKLLLSHCQITAPTSGRTGQLMVDEGNLVKASDIALVTINQIQPIYVSFTAPETQLPVIKNYMSSGDMLQVEAVLPGEESKPELGELTFLDNRVDTETGTIGLRGTFPNEKLRLWPGLFLNVRMRLTTNPGVIVIPAEAVQTGQQGQYVYVINEESKVESRPVVTGMSAGNRMVIDEGLKAGERVVTDGHLRLMPGFKVVIKDDLMPATKPAASVAGGNGKNH